MVPERNNYLCPRSNYASIGPTLRFKSAITPWMGETAAHNSKQAPAIT